MSDFKNKQIKGDKLYDHIATKKFESWESAFKEARLTRKEHYNDIIDIVIVEK